MRLVENLNATREDLLACGFSPKVLDRMGKEGLTPLLAPPPDASPEPPRPAGRPVAPGPCAPALPRPPVPYVAHRYTLLKTPELIGRRDELGDLKSWIDGRGGLGEGQILVLTALGGAGDASVVWPLFVAA